MKKVSKMMELISHDLSYQAAETDALNYIILHPFNIIIEISNLLIIIIIFYACPSV